MLSAHYKLDVRQLNYIVLIWQIILISEKKLLAAKFASLSNHHFPRRALYALISDLSPDGCKRVSHIKFVSVRLRFQRSSTILKPWKTCHYPSQLLLKKVLITKT